MNADRAQFLALAALASAIGFGALILRAWWIGGAAIAVALLQFYNINDPTIQQPGGKHVLRLGGMSWTLEEFLTHWAIIGRSGCGKTVGVIRTMFIQLLRSVPEFGCVAIDEKANFHKVLERVCAAAGRADKLIVIRPRRPGRDLDVPLTNTMNLIGDRTIPWDTYAQIVIDTAVACGQKTNNSFFKSQGRKTITTIFQTLDAVGITPTLADAYDFIADEQTYNTALEKLQIGASQSETCSHLLRQWQSFDAKAGEERSGIKSTTELYLNAFAAPELRDVFSSENPTIALSVVDKGKILCPSIPQAFLTQRRYITAWFKIAGYYHLLRRFDDFDDAHREKLTPIILLADEGQNSLLAAEEGLADHNTLDKIREARGTLVLAMQSYASALPAVDGRRDLAETIFTNLNNHVIGAIRDETGREMAANIFGKDWQTDRSFSYGPNSKTASVRKELRHIFHTGLFTRLPKFRAIIFHVEGKWTQSLIPPLTDDGKRVSPRFRLGLLARLMGT